MSHAGAPRLGRWSSVVLCCALVGCANIAGIDDLAYDLDASGPGAGSSGAPTSGATSTSTGEVTTTSGSSSAASTAEGSSSSGDGGSGGAGGSHDTTGSGGTGGGEGGTGGSPPTGFVPLGDRDEYVDLLQAYEAAIWHLDEADGAAIANDDGNVRYDDDFFTAEYDGNYLAEGGALTYEVPGVFPDHTAVKFAGGARVEVPIGEDPYYFPLYYAGNAFTLMFFFKLDAVPEAPVTVLSCYGESPFEDDRGWRVLLSDEVVLELVGSDDFDNRTVETFRFDIPNDRGWHFVLLAQNDDGEVRGYLDDGQEISDSSSILGMSDGEGLYSMGAAPGEAGSATVTLDEVAMGFEALTTDQIQSIRDCLAGEGCFEP